MSLVCSVSGIRGTLTGVVGEALTPWEIVRYTSAYVHYLRSQGQLGAVVLGRDARPSGVFIAELVTLWLRTQGYEVIDIGLTTTPTAQMAVIQRQASGGIMITASHNSQEWNALKLMDHVGEFLSPQAMRDLENAPNQAVFSWQLANLYRETGATQAHIQAVLAHPLVDIKSISRAKFKVGLDPVNSTGGLAFVPLLKQLGVQHIETIHGTPDGNFERNPEPISAHLGKLSSVVTTQSLDLGIALDPDGDRLALVDEKGQPIGEDYTLVIVADYVLANTQGPLVTNLSSTSALEELAQRHKVPYYQTAVGERYVVEKMKQTQAIIGGEGNGGVIDPRLHYGRDALVGIALVLSYLAKRQIRLSELRATYPNYVMIKDKLPASQNMESLFEALIACYPQAIINRTDGLHLRFPDSWVHLRPSNTEPIVRLYIEASEATSAQTLLKTIQAHVAACNKQQ